MRPGITTYTVNVGTTMPNFDKTLSVEGKKDNRNETDQVDNVTPEG